MRTEHDMKQQERARRAEALDRMGRDERARDTMSGAGRYAEPRSWIARTRDEIAAWFGDAEAMRRRQWDEAAGDHTGKGPVQHLDNDARIVEALNRRLTEDRDLDASSIVVTCQEGMVTLNGSVTTWAGVQRAEALALGVSGVKSVENKLAVA